MTALLKYDGPLRPFVKREESAGTMPEGKAAQLYAYGSPAAPYMQDVLPERGEFYEAKPYQAPDMYQGNPEGVFMQSFARYHPHGGRRNGMDGYMPGTAAVPMQQQQHVPSGGSRYIGGVPDAMMDAAVCGGYDGHGVQRQYGMGLPAMRQAPMGVSIEDIQRMQMYSPEQVESTRRTPPMDPVSLQKRKRNRIAQKKYRERKKMETTRVTAELNSQKEQLQKMESLSMNICEHHTRNAVLTRLEETKKEEIVALKNMLAGLKDAAAEAAATGCAPSGVDSSDHVDFPDLDCTADSAIVMDIIGDKFVEDSFAHVVRDLKTEVHGHIGCERRLPLLLNVVQERMLKAEGSPHFHTIRNRSLSQSASGEGEGPTREEKVEMKCEETDSESEEDVQEKISK